MIIRNVKVRQQSVWDNACRFYIRSFKKFEGICRVNVEAQLSIRGSARLKSANRKLRFHAPHWVDVSIWHLNRIAAKSCREPLCNWIARDIIYFFPHDGIAFSRSTSICAFSPGQIIADINDPGRKSPRILLALEFGPRLGKIYVIRYMCRYVICGPYGSSDD